MSFEIMSRVPVTRPSGLEQHRLAGEIYGAGDVRQLNRLYALAIDSYRRNICQLFQFQLRQVFSVLVTMKWRVDVCASVRDHLDFGDLKLNPGRIEFARNFAAEVVAYDRRRQAL